MNTDVALALMLVEVEARAFVKQFTRYVNSDNMDLPDPSSLEHAFKELDKARSKIITSAEG